MKKNNVSFIAYFALSASMILLPISVNFEIQEAVAAPAIASESLPKNLFVELFKKINPTVVNISTTQVLKVQPRGGGRRGEPIDPFQQFLEDFMMGQGSPMPQPKYSSLGTGFILEADGVIITNNHVIANATDIQVQLTENSEDSYKAEVIGQDAKFDVALIKIKTKNKLPFVELGDSDQLQVGEWVAAFGNPLGHGHTMSKGIVSAKERDIDDQNFAFPFIQTDASINPGNSGGPLVNTEGKVIGINTAIDARGQGIGFAIPINNIKRYLPELKSKGKVTRGYLGVGINQLTPEMNDQLGITIKKGAIVLNVSPKSPAKDAGLEIYDVITEIDGKPIHNAKDLSLQIAAAPIGQKINLRVFRNNKPLTITARVSERPDEEKLANSEEAPIIRKKGAEAPLNMGFSMGDLDTALAKQLRIDSAPIPSVVVLNVDPKGPAATAGIDVGDVILDINKKRVTSAVRASTLFTKGNNVLRIYRDNSTFLVFLEGK